MGPVSSGKIAGDSFRFPTIVSFFREGEDGRSSSSGASTIEERRGHPETIMSRRVRISPPRPVAVLACSPSYAWNPPRQIAEKMRSAGGPGEHALRTLVDHAIRFTTR